MATLPRATPSPVASVTSITSPLPTSRPASAASHREPRASTKLSPLDPGERLTPPPSAASMPLELRLRALEARVLGVPASQLRQVEMEEGAATLSRRVAAATRAVEEAVAQAPQLKVLYERYDTYAPLLRGSLDDEENVPDVLSPQAKAAMVIEARDDLADAERGLREIALLEGRGIAGAGCLEDIVALAPALETGRTQLIARKRMLAETRADVASLVERYTEFTSTVSELFVTLHDQVSALEEAVARAERRRANEKARIY
ncbi:hypothetical protein CC85DRAFT_288597 [Cutaneotrichosporon oleaginosum]|uniref:Uncharacterized protein n=1 Tax=Cutaneotrichosporon oleaginosum TaxID=879819 RepID=A0A0J0XEC5_9TREE|nr:uncharacterized protein CC85DRAFT_288597 [Cutaneotrichosporon oleaginosum]KLT39403.1 hypothetical protein CC85DRAFT_288597 [Cutaneotrichosporon oleaginosum]TXT07553.1 hypothetical protein COLE_04477 [Cutaneotrichosporon oleaginosum]